MVLRPRSGLENPLTGKGVVAGVRKSLKRKPLIKPYLGLLFSSFSRGVGGVGVSQPSEKKRPVKMSEREKVGTLPTYVSSHNLSFP